MMLYLLLKEWHVLGHYVSNQAIFQNKNASRIDLGFSAAASA